MKQLFIHRIAALALVCLLLPLMAGAETPVTGDILTTTWTADGSPYNVLGTARVPPGEVLTIEPGVIVEFQIDAPFLVEGQIHARGVEGDSVVFRKGLAAGWKGIPFTGADSSSLSYVRISDCHEAAIEVGADARLSIAHSLITENTADGVVATAFSRVWMDDSEVSGNDVINGGIYVRRWAAVQMAGVRIVYNHGTDGGGLTATDDSRVDARRCVFAHNQTWGRDPKPGGVGLFGSARGTFANCTIASNFAELTTLPFKLGDGGRVSDVGFAEFRNCIIWGNVPYGLVVSDHGTVAVEHSITQETIPGTGNLTADPLFTDPANGDFTLLPGSPAIDAGDPYDLTDIDGTRADMGMTGGDGDIPSIPRISVPSSVVVNSAAPRDFTAYNIGWTDLDISTLDLPDGFSTMTPFPLTIAPGDSATITLQYTPAEPSDIDTVLIITSNDIWQSPTRIRLIGVTGREVSGEVSGVWARSDGPMRVVGPITVPDGQILTIEAGVDVLFDVPCPITVYGTLHANGTPDDSVRFLPGATDAWQGIRFIESDSSSLVSTRVSGVSGSDGYGGILARKAAHLSLLSTTLSGNTALQYGGGISVELGTITLDSCEISNNHAGTTANTGQGGGVSVLYGTVSIQNTTIYANEAYEGAGIAVRDPWVAEGVDPRPTSGSISIADSRIVGNSGEIGGGIWIALNGPVSLFSMDYDVRISRTFITGNHATIIGGGIVSFADRFTPELSHCTIAGNGSMQLNAGGIGLCGGVSMNVESSIVWGNTPHEISLEAAGACPDILPTMQIEFSDIRGDTAWTGRGNITGDPQFTDPGSSDYSLASNSPCIDTANPYTNLGSDGTRADMGASDGDGVLSGIPRIDVPKQLLVSSLSPGRMVIRCVNAATLQIYSVTMPPFFTTDIQAPFSIAGNDSVVATISFIPEANRDTTTSIVIASSDTHMQRIAVTLNGLRGTTVGETTSGRWGIAGSPYRITEPVRVPEGDTLTIDPGVQVLLDGDVPFTIAGYLRTEGTADSTIEFTIGTAERWKGIRVPGGSATMRYTAISGGYHETAPNHTALEGNGGGIGISGSATTTVLLDHCTISGNTGRHGGGIAVIGPVMVTLDSCTVSGNATRRLGKGGAIYAYGGPTVKLDGCTITDNTCPEYGEGSAVYADVGSDVIMERCVVTGNQCHRGTIVMNEQSAVTLDNCTITLNFVFWTTVGTAGSYGAEAIFASNSTVTARNTIVWGNTGGDSEIDQYGGVISISYSDIEMVSGTWPGFNNINTYPLFRDQANSDFGLVKVSPCRDAGDPFSAPDPDGSVADIGAIPYYNPDDVARRDLPVRLSLDQNAPNPFNPTTSIRLAMPTREFAEVTVYNMNGQMVRTMHQGELDAGWHSFTWNGTDDHERGVGSGVYLCRVRTGAGMAVRRMLLVR